MTPGPYKIINTRKRCLVKAADALLRVAEISGLIKDSKAIGKPVDFGNIRNILVVRLAYIGDVVMTLPVLEPLKKAFPDASIHFLTSRAAAPLLDRNPFIDQVIAFNPCWFYRGLAADKTSELIPILKNRFDMGIDFRGDIRNIWHCLYRPGIPIRVSYSSGGGGLLLTHPLQWLCLKHKVEYHLDLVRHLGIAAERTDPKIYFSNEEMQRASELMRSVTGNIGRAPVVVHPGARLPLKCWPVDRYAELIRSIIRNDHGPVVLIDAPGSPTALEIAGQAPEVINLTGRLKLREMAAFCSLARVFVCNDSGPMHIAAASGTRVVALFGPSRPIETAPCGEDHTVIESTCRVKDDCDENHCRAGGMGCMASIPVEDVLREVLKHTAAA